MTQQYLEIKMVKTLEKIEQHLKALVNLQVINIVRKQVNGDDFYTLDNSRRSVFKQDLQDSFQEDFTKFIYTDFIKLNEKDTYKK